MTICLRILRVLYVSFVNDKKKMTYTKVNKSRFTVVNMQITVYSCIIYEILY